MCVTGALVREFVSLIVMYVHLYILRLAAELLYHHASTVQVVRVPAPHVYFWITSIPAIAQSLMETGKRATTKSGNHR